MSLPEHSNGHLERPVGFVVPNVEVAFRKAGLADQELRSDPNGSSRLLGAVELDRIQRR